jgi:hypothetical protein
MHSQPMKNTIQIDVDKLDKRFYYYFIFENSKRQYLHFRIIKPSLACVVQGQQDSLTLRLPHGPRPGLARPGEAKHDY